jgi:hypothetical protein
MTRRKHTEKCTNRGKEENCFTNNVYVLDLIDLG